MKNRALNSRNKSKPCDERESRCQGWSSQVVATVRVIKVVAVTSADTKDAQRMSRKNQGNNKYLQARAAGTIIVNDLYTDDNMRYFKTIDNKIHRGFRCYGAHCSKGFLLSNSKKCIQGVIKSASKRILRLTAGETSYWSLNPGKSWDEMTFYRPMRGRVTWCHFRNLLTQV